jgi:hypothetical protein
MTMEQTMAAMSLIADPTLDRWQESQMYEGLEAEDILAFAQACTDVAAAASHAAYHALRALGERQTAE